MLVEPGFPMKLQSSEGGQSWESTKCEATKSTKPSTRNGGGPVMTSTGVESRIKLYDDLEVKSYENVGKKNEVQVQLGVCDGNRSKYDEGHEVCLSASKVQGDRMVVQKRKQECLNKNEYEAHSVISTGMKEEESTVSTLTHCKKVIEVHGVHSIVSAKGDFINSKISDLKFACEAKTMGASILQFDSKLIELSAGLSIGPTTGPVGKNTFRSGDLDQPGGRGTDMRGRKVAADQKSSETLE